MIIYIFFYINIGILFALIVYLINLILFKKSGKSIFYNFKKSTPEYEKMVKKTTTKHISLVASAIVVLTITLMLQILHFLTANLNDAVSTLVVGSCIMVFINLLIINSIIQKYKT